MSLTREQWLEMYKEVTDIERTIKFCNEIPLPKRQRMINKEIKSIKDKIQSVVGQLD